MRSRVCKGGDRRSYPVFGEMLKQSTFPRFHSEFKGGVATRPFYFGILLFMKLCIDIDGKNIEYEIRRYRQSRCVRISIRPQGVLVTAPKWISQKEIKRFVESRLEWIAQHVLKIQEPKRSFREVESLREKTRDRVWDMLERVNTVYQHDFQRVFIRDTVSRWGSCSESGNLNFSVRAGLLPEHLLEYLVAHELSHLKEMNHSVRFWNLVAKAVPDYWSRRRALRGWKEN